MSADLEKLKTFYPKIEEVLGREQFYRQNPLPTEINYLIEEHCLDFNNLNGLNSKVWKLQKSFDEDFHSYSVLILELWKDRNLNPTREIEIVLCSHVEIFRTLLVRSEKYFSIGWIEDQQNYFKYRKLAFNLLQLQSKENERSLSLMLKENSLEARESIQSNY